MERSILALAAAILIHAAATSPHLPNYQQRVLNAYKAEFIERCTGMVGGPMSFTCTERWYKDYSR